MKTVVVIPFRDRGIDECRQANLSAIMNYWGHVNAQGYQWPVVVRDDGRSGLDRFNRSAAYNSAIRDYADADVFVFCESDMLVPIKQIAEAANRARRQDHLVVAFSHYHYLSRDDSVAVRAQVMAGKFSPDAFSSRRVRTDSIGAVVVASMRAIEAVGGFDESFDGNGYDDDAMKRAFEICCGPTMKIPGPGYHLYHDPAWPGNGIGGTLTPDDAAATEDNRRRYAQYKRATRPEQIRELTAGNQIWHT